MYEPMAVLRSLAELHHKFQPESAFSSQSLQQPSNVFEDALNKAIEEGTPAFMAEENQAKIIDYKGEMVASFHIHGVEMICLPQVYELFLKSMVGGLHTVYTKLKRLDITPLVCNVEQVRALRSVGAIQPGVNRCKLIAKTDFDLLLEDCSSSCNRPGRPAKRPTDEWFAAQAAAIKQSRVYSEVNSPTNLTPSHSFSSDSILSTPNLINSAPSILSGMGGVNGGSAPSGLLSHLLPGFNQLLIQQMIASAKMRQISIDESIDNQWNCREREEDNEEDERNEEKNRIREEEEEEEEKESQSSNESTEDSPSSDKNEEKRTDTEKQNENRLHDGNRDDSTSRDQTNSVSQNNSSNSSPSCRSSQNRSSINNDCSKLISLLENTITQLKRKDEVSEERLMRIRAEKSLQLERRRSKFFKIRWIRTKRELHSLQNRVRQFDGANQN